jgi:hypothetical protein
MSSIALKRCYRQFKFAEFFWSHSVLIRAPNPPIFRINHPFRMRSATRLPGLSSKIGQICSSTRAGRHNMVSEVAAATLNDPPIPQPPFMIEKHLAARAR